MVNKLCVKISLKILIVKLTNDLFSQVCFPCYLDGWKKCMLLTAGWIIPCLLTIGSNPSDYRTMSIRSWASIYNYGFGGAIIVFPDVKHWILLVNRHCYWKMVPVLDAHHSKLFLILSGYYFQNNFWILPQHISNYMLIFFG